MASGVYMVQDDGQLIEMKVQTPPAEDQLQALLAKHPNLLAGDQINDTAPRRWLLISREVALASEQDGAGRWSVDHLFLDQDATPTIVEVKRASDTRIRREVVGQILEYAANAVTYWNMDQLRQVFENRCKELALDPAAELIARLGREDYEQFWLTARDNLQQSKLRLLVVADSIPPELRRMVEYLNEQMRDAEVLAVEVRQYGIDHAGPKVLVPLVMGQTVQAQGKKSSTASSGKRWDEVSFLKEIDARLGTEYKDIAQALLTWAKAHNLRIWYGSGDRSGSFYPLFDSANGPAYTFAAWTYGGVEIQFQYMKSLAPFNDLSMRRQLLDRLNQLRGVSISPDRLDKRPSIPYSVLSDPATLQDFLATFDWYLAEIVVCSTSPG